MLFAGRIGECRQYRRSSNMMRAQAKERLKPQSHSLQQAAPKPASFSRTHIPRFPKLEIESKLRQSLLTLVRWNVLIKIEIRAVRTKTNIIPNVGTGLSIPYLIVLHRKHDT